MEKFHKILSNILLILNPACGFLMVTVGVYCIEHGGYWWLLTIPFSVIVICLVMTYHGFAYKKETIQKEREYLIWKSNISKTHQLIYTDGEGVETWKHLRTGKILYH